MARRSRRPAMLALGLALFFMLAQVPAPGADARTIVVGGATTANGHVRLTYTVAITGLDPAQLTAAHEVVVNVPAYASGSVDGFSQSVSGFGITASPAPTSVSGQKGDAYGNPYYQYTWSLAGYQQTSMTIIIATDFDCAVTGSPTPESFADPYPVQAPGQGQYLASTAMAQSANSQIVSTAQSLVAGATTEAAAVESVMDFIKGQISNSPDQPYDAVHTLQDRRGTCTNRANLALALLRSAGIPARFVVGAVGSQPYTVEFTAPEGQGTMEAGWSSTEAHTWIEVYYPQKGVWVGYDPYLNFGFVDQRHVKAGISVDSDVLTSDASGLSYFVSTYLNPEAIVQGPPAFHVDFSVASEQGRYTFRSLKESPGGDAIYVLGRDMVNAPTPTPTPAPIPTATPTSSPTPGTTPSPAPNATVTATPPGAGATATPPPSPSVTPLPQGPGQAGDGTFRVSFEAVDAATGAAIPGTTITLDGRPLPADARGAYAALTTNGTHTLAVSAPGYGNVSTTFTVAGGDLTQTVRLTAATGGRDGLWLPAALCCGTLIAAAGLLIILGYRYRHGRA